MSDETTELGGGTLTAEQVRHASHGHYKLRMVLDVDGFDIPQVMFDWQAIADELNDMLVSGKAKDLLLRTFGLAQMMYDCWLEECKAGDNVDVSACNAYSYEFDQIVQAMFDMGTDPNDSDYYRSAELGRGTCELHDCDGSFSAVNRPVWRCDCGAFMTQYTDATTYHKPRFCPNCGARIRKAVTR